MKDVIIVGAGCAGMTAALYSARSGKSVLIFEKECIGGQIASSPLVENYPGIHSMTGMEFADTLFSQIIDLDVKLEIDEVVEIKNDNSIYLVKTSNRICKARSVVIATGTKHRTLGLDKEETFRGRGVYYCAICDGALFKNKDVAVVGGGNTAITEAIYLSNFCKTVTIIHRSESFKADPILLNKARKINNIKWLLNTTLIRLNGTNQLNGLSLYNSKLNNENDISVDGLFVAIGQIPQTKNFSNIIKTNSNGFFDVNEDCKTDLHNLFVAGDCRNKHLRQLTTAISDGANAATKIE